MPLIAGNKYSCEPCIRGHRATHCAHTDRLLIEVRKPGRPLDRCCHKIGSCVCGRLGGSSSLSLSILRQSTSTSTSLSQKSRMTPVAVVDAAGGNAGWMGEGGDVRLRTQEMEIEAKEEEGQTKVLISKEQPYGRELRLSVSAEGGNSKSGERRRGKVFKRHRLGNQKASSTSPNVRVKELDDNVDDNVDVEMGEDEDGDGDEPALSPSLSSSESEEGGSRSPEVRGMELIDVAVAAGRLGGGFGGEVVSGKVVERNRGGISISDLLS